MSPEEVELCAAACDAVLPPDEEPGAVDLGVVEYIDRRFDRLPGGPWGPEQFMGGLRKLDEWALHKEGSRFVELMQERREHALRTFSAEADPEGRNFAFELLVQTMEGALCDPSYGGNRNRAGWALIGFQVPCPNPSCH